MKRQDHWWVCPDSQMVAGQMPDMYWVEDQCSVMHRVGSGEAHLIGGDLAWYAIALAETIDSLQKRLEEALCRQNSPER